MKRKIAEAWAKALRSGEYRRGMSALCAQEGRSCKWCCLGVLADVSLETDWERFGPYANDGGGKTAFWALKNADKEAKRPRKTQGSPSSGFIKVDMLRIPPRFGKDLGFDSAKAFEDFQAKYIKMNDDDEASFAEIADEIEREFLGGGDKRLSTSQGGRGPG